MATELSLGKRFLFSVVTLAIFFALVEGLLAVAGIRPVVVDDDPYVGFSDQQPLFRPTAGDTRLRTAANKLSLFNDQSFRRNKAADTFRIFTLGGSVTYGRPFAGDTSFSAWLQSYLDRAAPDRNWEVINAGGISYASYRVARLMEELVDYEPDLFIVLTGHNEFLEKRTYSALIAEPRAVTETKLLLQRTRLWALGRKLVTQRRTAAAERYELTGEVLELLDSSAGLDEYVRDDEFRRQVLAHYRVNLQRMTQLAGSVGAAMILVDLPSNRKDFSPFKSQHRDGLPIDDLQRYPALVEAAVAALDGDRPESAIELTESVVTLDPLYAEGQFLHGRALFAAARYQEAAVAFDRAVEEDVCPLRALEPINHAVAEAAARDGVPMVDFRDLVAAEMRTQTGQSVPGDELFLDHVHPTVATHGLLARALVDQIGALEIAQLAPAWHDQVGTAVQQEILARVDDAARANAYKNLSKVLIWAGKRREAEKYTRLATANLGDDWEVRYNAGSVVRLNPSAAPAYDLLGLTLAAAGDLMGAEVAGQQAVELDPDQAGAWNNLAVHLDAVGRSDEALAATQEALRRQPDFAEAHNNLGKILSSRGEAEAALAAFERALELRPRYLEALYNRGLALGDLQQLEAAEDAFTAVLRLDPDFVPAYGALGGLELARNRPQAAIEAFERVVELEPETVENWEILVKILAGVGNAKAADDRLRRGLAIHPEAAGLLRLQARSLAQSGRLDEAANLFERAIDSDPEQLAARVDLGNLRMTQGDSEGALTVFRAALAIRPDDDRLHHLVASTLLVTGEFEAARPHLEQAVRLNPSNTAATLDLARLSEQEGRTDEAAALYRTALQFDPQLDEASQGLARVAPR